MKLTRRAHLKLLAGTAVALPTISFAAQHESDGPTTHEVEMLNRDPETSENFVFNPSVVRAMPGDTIRFVATDRGHNSASSEGMIPEEAESWKSQIGQDFEITLDAEGAYGYHCTPHQTVGMVGLILVGDVSGNYEALKEVRQRGRAAQRWEGIFAEADALLAEEESA